MLTSTKKQRGFTLIEMLIVVAIAAAMFFAVFTLAGRVNERSQINETTTAINQLMAEAKVKFRSQGSFAGATNASLIQMGIVPQALIRGGAIETPWGHTFIRADPTNGIPNSGLLFATYGIPAHLCSSVLTALEGNYPVVFVEGNQVKNLGAATPLQFNAATAAGHCNAPAGGVRRIYVIVTR